jgi:hypothetical protein
MDRRTFNNLAGAAAMSTIAGNSRLSAEIESSMPVSGKHTASGEVILEDATFFIAFDAVSGALTRLKQKSSGWEIQRRPELGLSFRLHGGLPGLLCTSCNHRDWTKRSCRWRGDDIRLSR